MGRKEQLMRELERTVEALVKDYKAEKIILFGSLAAGKTGEWSDIDLVVVKDTDKPFWERLREVVEIVRPSLAMDIMVYTPQEMRSLEDNLLFPGKRF